MTEVRVLSRTIKLFRWHRTWRKKTHSMRHKLYIDSLCRFCCFLFWKYDSKIAKRTITFVFRSKNWKCAFFFRIPSWPLTWYLAITCVDYVQVVDGYFVHFFVPPSDLAPLPLDIVFVLDRSYSMIGRPIRQLKVSSQLEWLSWMKMQCPCFLIVVAMRLFLVWRFFLITVIYLLLLLCFNKFVFCRSSQETNYGRR